MGELGDIPDPERACSALEADPGLLSNAQPDDDCGGMFANVDITISGELDGQSFDAKVESCGWGPQIGLLTALGISSQGELRSHTLPPHDQVLHVGQQRTFPPGELQPGDLVVCDIPGHGQAKTPIPADTGHILTTDRRDE